MTVVVPALQAREMSKGQLSMIKRKDSLTSRKVVLALTCGCGIAPDWISQWSEGSIGGHVQGPHHISDEVQRNEWYAASRLALVFLGQPLETHTLHRSELILPEEHRIMHALQSIKRHQGSSTTYGDFSCHAKTSQAPQWIWRSRSACQARNLGPEDLTADLSHVPDVLPSKRSLLGCPSTGSVVFDTKLQNAIIS
jgi:hypothetical protein